MKTKASNHKRIPFLLLLLAAAVGMLLLASCRQESEPQMTETAANAYEKTLVVATDDDY